MKMIKAAVALLAISSQMPCATAQTTSDRPVVRTFIVERHAITKDAYERAKQGNDVRLASSGPKLRSHFRMELRSQGDLFTGWSKGEAVPYRIDHGVLYAFVGDVGEIQPAEREGYRRLVVKDARLVRMFKTKDGEGKKTRVPILRNAEVTVEFPLDGNERAEIYAVPRGRKKFEYQLVTVREDVSKRREIIIPRTH